MFNNADQDGHGPVATTGSVEERIGCLGILEDTVLQTYVATAVTALGTRHLDQFRLTKIVRHDDLSADAALAQALDIPVIASGGVSSMKDIQELSHVSRSGIEGVIVGKSIYSGSLDLKKAIAFTKSCQCE